MPAAGQHGEVVEYRLGGPGQVLVIGVVQPTGHPEALGHGETGEDAATSGHLQDAGLGDPVGLVGGDGLAVEHDLPGGRHHQAGDGPHQRGLAGAVGAEHRHHFAVAHVEIHAEEDLDAVIAGIEGADHEEMAHPVGPFLTYLGVRHLGDLALRDVLGHESGGRTKQRRADDEQRDEDQNEAR